MFKVLIGVVLKLYLLITKDSLWSKAWGKTFFAMRNTLDRSYRDRHLNGQKVLPIVVKKLIVKKMFTFNHNGMESTVSRKMADT